MKKALVISILIFIIVACAALYIVINKGSIGDVSLLELSKGEEKESEKAIPQLDFELEKEYIASTTDETCDIIATIDGEKTTEGLIITSSNEDVAIINEYNQVVAIGDGRATIKVSYDGIEKSKDIRVITPIKSMTFTTTNSTVRVGKELQMKLKITPSDASTDPLVYTSSDEEIATVDHSGIVTGVSAGKVTITVYDQYTDTTKTVNLTIKD